MVFEIHARWSFCVCLVKSSVTIPINWCASLGNSSSNRGGVIHYTGGTQLNNELDNIEEHSQHCGHGVSLHANDILGVISKKWSIHLSMFIHQFMKYGSKVSEISYRNRDKYQQQIEPFSLHQSLIYLKSSPITHKTISIKWQLHDGMEAIQSSFPV